MRFRKLSQRGKIIYVISALLFSLLIGGIGFVWWAAQTAAALPEALAALQSDGVVEVAVTPWLTFTPVERTPTVGFILYPAARVDPRAYAPAARAIAAGGYLVVIPPMPLNLAVLAPGRAAAVMAAYPAITAWALGGHSLGGAMAVNYVAAHPGQVDTLILWAAYPTASDSLAERTDLTVYSIYAANDGMATVAEIDATRAYLPADTVYVPITGGNHGQFGWYTFLEGDNVATISHADQQAQVIDVTLTALAGANGVR